MALVEIFQPEHSNLVSDNFKSFLENNTYVDLMFICKNNRKVGAHQIVMGCLSKFLSDLLIQNQNETKDKIIYLSVPDIRAKIMKYILQFVYTGKVMVNEEDLSEFNDDLILLGMPLAMLNSVDKGQTSASNNITLSNPPMNYQPTENLANANVSNESGIAISNVQSLNNLPPSSTTNSNTVPGLNPMNQHPQIVPIKSPDGSSINNPCPNVYNQTMPVMQTNQPAPIPVPSYSTKVINRTGLSNSPMINSSNEFEQKKTRKQSTATPQQTNKSKKSKLETDQLIDLAESDDDDVITLS